MLAPANESKTNWEARCDRCLGSSPLFEKTDRAGAELELEALGWARARNDQWRCVECKAKPPSYETIGTRSRSRRRR